MNRCEADKERRRAANVDSAVTETVGDFTRRISFETGYDHCDFGTDCGCKGTHGRHGMTMRFDLVGRKGAVGWSSTLMDVYPGNVNHGKTTNAKFGMYSGAVSTHAPTGDESYQHKSKCNLLSGGECYGDNSYLAGDAVLDAFVSHGPGGVWRELEAFYRDYFEGES